MAKQVIVISCKRILEDRYSNSFENLGKHISGCKGKMYILKNNRDYFVQKILYITGTFIP